MGAFAQRVPIVVLVVEDDSLLRMDAVQMIEEAGFEALEADNADQAIVLHLGRVAMRGDPQSIRTDPELKRLYLGGT